MENSTSIQTESRTLSQLFLSLLLHNILFSFFASILSSNTNTDQGTILAVSAILSFIPPGIYMLQMSLESDLTAVRKKCPPRIFLLIFMTDLILNLLATQIAVPAEYLFGLFGITASIPEDSGLLSPAYLLYACLIGPVLEELIYRGILFRTLRRYGLVPAMILSSFCFAIMHHDFYQGLSAFFGGLIYAWAADRYSFPVALMLHIANNSFAEITPYLDEMGTAGPIVLSVFIFISAVFVLASALRFLLSSKHRGAEPFSLKHTAAIWKNCLFWAVILWDALLLAVNSFHRL